MFCLWHKNEGVIEVSPKITSMTHHVTLSGWHEGVSPTPYDYLILI